MPSFLQFLGAIIGVIGVLAALAALVTPGLGLLVAAGMAAGSLSLAGVLAGIAGITLRIEEQTRVNRAIFNAIDEFWLKPREAEMQTEGREDTAEQPANPTMPSPELAEARARLAELRANRSGRWPTNDEERAAAEVRRLEHAEEQQAKPFGWNR